MADPLQPQNCIPGAARKWAQSVDEIAVTHLPRSSPDAGAQSEGDSVCFLAARQATIADMITREVLWIHGPWSIVPSSR